MGVQHSGNVIPLSIRTFEPGKLIVSLPIVDRALVAGHEARFLGHRSPVFEALRMGYPTSVGPMDVFASESKLEWDLEVVAAAMRRHACGGTLLVIPTKSTSWCDSIQQGSFLPSGPHEMTKRHLAWRDRETEEHQKQIHDNIVARLLGSVGRLTAVDGAVIVRRDMEVLTFGAKIKVENPSAMPNHVLVLKPFEGCGWEKMDVQDLGWGTRHQSAARFVLSQRGSIAIVSSQDGRISVMAWNPAENLAAVIAPAEYAIAAQQGFGRLERDVA
jgi:hypothetical protein